MGENSTDIFRPYSRPNPFRGDQICPYPSPGIQHPTPYPYPNTQIVYLRYRYLIVSYPTQLTLSVFESESGQKYKNKCNISDIRLYPIRFHPYIWGYCYSSLPKGNCSIAFCITRSLFTYLSSLRANIRCCICHTTSTCIKQFVALNTVVDM